MCQAESPKDTWGAAKHALTKKLFEENIDITELAKTWLDRKPENREEALFKVALMLRCGMSREMIDALHELKEVAPNLPGKEAEYIYDTARRHDMPWEVLKTTAELFGDKEGMRPRIVDDIRGSGWTAEQIDTWFAERPKRPDLFWTKKRYIFLEENGTADPYLKKLAADAQRKSEDIEGICTLLEILAACPYNYKDIRHKAKWAHFAWLPKEVKPKRA
ncbi:MAG: hypothetical protein PVH19_03775, partial [Planctomycetia bacterium]